MAEVIQINVELPPVSHVANGKVKEAQIEASETKRVNMNTRIQTPKITKRAYGTNATRTPAEVAMPLPPLNRSQQVKL